MNKPFFSDNLEILKRIESNRIMHQRTLSLLWAPDRMLDVVISDPNLYDTTKGVYAVWYWGYNSNSAKSRIVVKVGQGRIKSRLQDFRRIAGGIYAFTTLYAT